MNTTCNKCGLGYEKGKMCKPCHAQYQRAWRKKRKEAGLISNYNKKWLKQNREKVRKWHQEYRKRPEVIARVNELAVILRRDPLAKFKKACRNVVWRAIAAGKLSRKPCEVCGNTTTHAHHDDYTKPLTVRWLCRLHHDEHHEKRRK